MSFTCPHMIRGWFTDIPYYRGRGGTRIPEFGMAARTSHSESASESASLPVLDGAGLIGDSIGIIDIQFITTTGTSPAAPLFTTGAISTAEMASTVELASAETQGTGLPLGTSVGEAEFSTVRAQQPHHSTEIPRLLGGTLNHAVRVAYVRVPSTATVRADRQGAFRRAEAPVLVAERRVAVVEQPVVAAEDLAAGAGIGNRNLGGCRLDLDLARVILLLDREI